MTTTMVPCLLRFILVIWCIHHTLSRPTRKTVRLFRIRSSSTTPTSIFDLDQTFEGNSFVEDYMPQRDNIIDELRKMNPWRRLPSKHFLSHPSNGVFLKNNFPGYRELEGVVTVGESRSYSVVKQTRNNEKQDEESTRREPSTISFTYETTTGQPLEQETESIILTPEDSSDSKLPMSFLTEDRPYATALQRSQFSVEEAVHATVPAFDITRNRDSVPYSATAQPATTSSSTPPTTVTDSGQPKENPSSKNANFAVAPNVETTSPESSSQTGPVSYRTSLKTATAGSSVSFYRRFPSILHLTSTESTVLPTERLKTETRVERVSYREEVVGPQRAAEGTETGTKKINEDKSYQFTNLHDKSFHHVQVTHLEPPEKKRALGYHRTTQRYSQPEQVYGMPEENYEVDESLSLQSNGRTHGVQTQQTQAADKNKFGYVVEGRNFKKYRVEERTNDGFIVGEYGVVRHDDGSLRGVRYTADSTINPRVIYDALVKFLSL